MYRTVVNRILLTKNTGGGRRCLLRFPDLRTAVSSSRFSTTTEPQTSPNRPLNPADSSTSSSSTSFQTSSGAGDIPRQERKNPPAEYQGEQARVLQASLRHVVRTLCSTILKLYSYFYDFLKS